MTQSSGSKAGPDGKKSEKALSRVRADLEEVTSERTTLAKEMRKEEKLWHASRSRLKVRFLPFDTAASMLIG